MKWRRVFASVVVLLAASSCGGRDASLAAPKANAIVSIDYCADLMVLKLVPKDNIAGISREADVDQSFVAPRAQGLPRIRPDIESILRLKPKIVVKSYGGGPQIDKQLEKAGIKVVQLGYASSLADISQQTKLTAQALGVAAQGDAVAAAFERQLLSAKKVERRPTLLYVTLGGVTTGPGSIIDEAITAAGYRNYDTRAGWHSIPLEALTRKKPDAVMTAYFDNKANDQDAWSSARHPLVAEALRDTPRVDVPGASVSCGNWMMGDVVEQLASQLPAMRERR